MGKNCPIVGWDGALGIGHTGPTLPLPIWLAAAETAAELPRIALVFNSERFEMTQGPVDWTADWPKIIEEGKVEEEEEDAGMIVEFIDVEMIDEGDADSKLIGELGGELFGLVQVESSHPVPSWPELEPFAQLEELLWRCLLGSLVFLLRFHFIRRFWNQILTFKKIEKKF